MVDVVAIQQAETYARKLHSAATYKRPSFTPVAWFDASLLTGNDGDVVRRMTDQAGRNNDIAAPSAALAPTLKVGALNGKNVLDFGLGAGKYMASGAPTNWMSPVQAQPLTLVAVVKAYAASTLNNLRGIIGAGGGTTIMGVNGTTAMKNLIATTSGSALSFQDGTSLSDDQWHIIIVNMTTTSGAMWIDGCLTRAMDTNNTFGSAGATSNIVLGKSTQTLDGQIAEAGILQGHLTINDVADLFTGLAQKWGLTLKTTPRTANIHDVTDANGQAVRLIYSNDKIKDVANPPLIVWNHQLSSTNLWVPTDALGGVYALMHSLANEGYVVAVPINHGTGNWSALPSDGGAAEAAAKSTLGISNFSRIVLVGLSMGGSLSPIEAKSGGFVAPVKGVYLIDGACNLNYMYNVTGGAYKATIDPAFSITAGTLSSASSAGATSISSSVSFPSGTKIMIGVGTAQVETVTTTGAPTGSGPYTIPVPALSQAHASGVAVTDYPTKTAGFDPCAWTAADVPAGIRWRFQASTADTSAPKANNTDVLVPILNAAGAPEVSTLAHPDGHLAPGSFQSYDILAFADRCV